MRVGKTHISLKTADLLKCKTVIFFSKKKALSSIASDYKLADYDFNIYIDNYEQVEKYRNVKADLYILDEAHCLGAYPKKTVRTQRLREMIGMTPVIYLSGTPSPESYSQLFHQFAVSGHSPFDIYPNFYKWAHDFVNIQQRRFNGVPTNDYSKAKKDDIFHVLSKYFINYTQQEAGFKQAEIIEEVKIVKMNDNTRKYIQIINRKKVLTYQEGSITADTPVKLLSKIHQLSGGSVKTDEGKSLIIDTSKIRFIKENYKHLKIAIYYKFVAEATMIKKLISNYTESSEEFNQSKDKVFISQIQSGSMGINLSSADVLIFINIDFSSMTYQQARARLQAMDRDKPQLIHFIFSDCGIELEVLEAVRMKQDYTVHYFKHKWKDLKWAS
jgi:hypothetical protein